MRTVTFTNAMGRGYLQGAAAKQLRKQMKLAYLSARWRSITSDLKYMDTAMLDIFLIDKTIDTVLRFEHMVNSYIQMEYMSLEIKVKPKTYRIGEAKEVFGQLAYDSENSREEPILFVG